MAGWVRVATGFTSHPKVLEIGIDGEGMWLRGLCYAGEQLTNGFIPTSYIKRMGDVKGLAIAAKLVCAGLWIEEDGGYRIHDYLTWQQSRDDIREISSKRAEAGRRGGKQKSSNLLANGQQDASKLLDNCSSKTLPDLEVDKELEREPRSAERGMPPKPPNSVKPDPKPKKEPTYPAEFDALWDGYPKGRGGKPETYAAWKLLTHKEQDAALAALPLFWAGRDWNEGFQKAPDQWLKHRHFENPPPPMSTNNRASPHDRADRNMDAVQRIARGEA